MDLDNPQSPEPQPKPRSSKLNPDAPWKFLPLYEYYKYGRPPFVIPKRTEYRRKAPTKTSILSEQQLEAEIQGLQLAPGDTNYNAMDWSPRRTPPAARFHETASLVEDGVPDSPPEAGELRTPKKPTGSRRKAQHTPKLKEQ